MNDSIERKEESCRSENEKAFISAIYNALAIIIFAICIGLCYLLFSVLQVFIRSILWSLLTSAFLFSSKKFLTDFARDKLEKIEKNDSILVIELALAPIKLIDSLIEFSYSFIKDRLIQIVIFVCSIIAVNLIYSFNDPVFHYVSAVYTDLITRFTNFQNFIENSWLISFTIIIVYLFTISFYWNNEYKFIFQIISFPICLIIFLFISKLFGSYTTLLIGIFVMLTLIGLFISINDNLKTSSKKSSDIYFKLLFWGFVSIKFRYDLFISVLLVILIWKLFKLTTLYAYNITHHRVKDRFQKVKHLILERKEVLAPQPSRVFLQFFVKGDRKLNHSLQKTMDTIITIIMIVGLMAILILSMVFLAIQVQSESVELLSISRNVLNQSELIEWLPEKANMNKLYLSAMSKIHLHGRNWLLSSLKSWLNSENVTGYSALESQIIQHWDNIYSFLNSSSDETFLKKKYWNNWKTKIGDKKFNLNQIISIIKDNMGILISILDSLYNFILSNINLLFTIMYKILWIVFASGFAVMNFIFSFLVYLSASFYLLSMSSDRFKPLVWLSEINFLKILNKESSSDILSMAIEDSIRSVFLASLKMALFYGIYTYLINCLFCVSIVYLASIGAAFLAFLPIFGTYWMALPGALELWFIQDSPFLALIFILFHLLPYLASVDQSIYSEIKASHPYLTGLAFVGGVYLAGLEGAFIGPIVLCLIIVIGKLFNSFDSNISNFLNKRE